MQGIGIKTQDNGILPASKDIGKNRRKSRWKLKFHHQALPPEYLNHYEASMMSPQPSSGISSSPTPILFTGNVKSKLPPEAQTSVRFDDLPYMGEMTLDNAKPRRGRKPKKADICHLIYKNYGTTVVEEPLNLCVRDQISSINDFQLPGSASLQETLNIQSKDSKRKSKKSLARERLEKTFKEKGFLIQTQQLESAQGATYCKFRQLRKFTRYLFRSWKHHLPGDVVDNGVNSQIT
ncbi:uncharacterized protein LOC113553187 [Rhopalosiphum maidis]|uniref:uncharacterized protein LOC113553187 n=1 Tax=Rhopalosiphum maidis TaxID=43146 RepID=UPI000EFFA3F1|nr:uncharacterized protein LOC113553187 [Rhopalosiphum maidis]XP_060841433.1 uncharacterized protein LOC132922111 [Rhopalosiphum padi]